MRELIILAFAVNCSLLPSATAQTKSFTKDAGTETNKPIEVTSVLSESVLSENHSVRFYVSVTNRATRTISNIQLRKFSLEGLTITLLCLSDLGKNSCESSEQSSNLPKGSKAISNNDVVAKQLEPGRSIVFWGEILAGRAHERQTALAELTWTDARSLQSSTVVPMGEIIVQSRWENWRSTWGYDLIKDLALPIVLLLLGALLAVYDKKKENRRKRDEEIREQIAQTWNSMLPESHKLSTRVYMPLDAALSAAIDELGTRQKALTESKPEAVAASEIRALYYFLLMCRRMRLLSDEAGGWYFKDRVGETLVGISFDYFWESFLVTPPNADLRWSLAVGEIEPKEKLGPFTQRLQSADDLGNLLREVQGYFIQWLKSPEFDGAFKCLKSARAVLAYEMNRPYEYWYGHNEPLSSDEEVEGTLRGLAKTYSTRADYRGLEQLTEGYIRKARTRSSARTSVPD